MRQDPSCPLAYPVRAVKGSHEAGYGCGYSGARCRVDDRCSIRLAEDVDHIHRASDGRQTLIMKNGEEHDPPEWWDNDEDAI